MCLGGQVTRDRAAAGAQALQQHTGGPRAEAEATGRRGAKGAYSIYVCHIICGALVMRVLVACVVGACLLVCFFGKSTCMCLLVCFFWQVHVHVLACLCSCSRSCECVIVLRALVYVALFMFIFIVLFGGSLDSSE